MFHSLEDKFIAVVAVVQRAVHSADGGSGSAGFFGNFQVRLFVPQHGGNVKALGKR